MNAIDSLAQAGTVTWLDDLSRDRIETGNLADIIATKSVGGVTTNPAIFAAAMSHGTAYDAQIAELKAASTSADHAVYAMSIRRQRRAGLHRGRPPHLGGHRRHPRPGERTVAHRQPAECHD